MSKKPSFFFMTARQKLLFVLVIAGQVLSNLLDLLSLGVVAPFVFLVSDPSYLERNAMLRTLYKAVGFSEPEAFLMTVGLLVLVFLLLSAIFKILANQSNLRLTRSISIQLSSHQLKTMLGLQYRHFERIGATKMKFILTSDLQISVNGVLVPTIELASKSIVSVIVLGMMLALNPVVILALGAGFGLFYAVVFLLQKNWLHGLGTKTRNLSKTITRQIADLVGSIREVKFYGAQELNQEEMRKHQQELASLTFRSSFMGTIPRISLETLILGSIVVYLLLNLGSGTLKDLLPVLGIIIVVFFRLSGIFQGIFTSFSKIRMNLPTYNEFRSKVIELSEESLQEPPTHGRTEPPFERELELRNVEFAYEPGIPVLKGVNLTVKHGTWIGFAGTSGSGKSTLADIVSGLLRPDAGELRLDGQLVTDPERIWKSGHLAYVSQANVLVERTIAENIAFGVAVDQIDRERVAAAARAACIEDYILSCPKKYGTVFGEAGLNPSGGQRQRLALARALYRNARILILDEVTSALDDKTEQAILNSLQALKGQTTVLAISHKPAILNLCDEVLILDKGEVVDRGLWADLSQRRTLPKDEA